MDKSSIWSENDINKLRTRVEFLEKENRWYYSVLDLAASMGDIHQGGPKTIDIDHLLDMTRCYLDRIIHFKSTAFFLVNESDHTFNLAQANPLEDQGVLQLELDHQIEIGNFAWALKQNRAILVDGEVIREKIVLHPLATRFKIKGMMIGRLAKPLRYIPSDWSALVSIILHNTANAMENGELYQRLSNQNKNLENEVRARTSALEHMTVELKNNIQELKDFTFVASHDLREPLRKLVTFGERLRTNYGSKLDRRAEDYLKVMEKASIRMQKLINSLVQLSKVTTKGGDIKPASLDKVINQVMTDLESRIKRSGAHILLGDLPTLPADEMQMRQLFKNLILNAIQFNKKNTPPRISITSRHREDGFWEFWVMDEGIGFDQKQADRIFRPFERLSGRSEKDGSGMGLAICKKIVERHGGTITAQSTKQTGATFIFRIPEKVTCLAS